MKAFREDVKQKAAEIYTFRKENKAPWEKLFKVEASVIQRCLLRLTELEIPSIPIHDSIIVPSSCVETAKEILGRAYKDVCNFELFLG